MSSDIGVSPSVVRIVVKIDIGVSPDYSDMGVSLDYSDMGVSLDCYLETGAPAVITPTLLWGEMAYDKGRKINFINHGCRDCRVR